MKGMTKGDEPPEIDGGDETQPRRLVLRRHLDLHRRRQDIDIAGVDPRVVEAAKEVTEGGPVLVPSAVAVTAVVVVDPRRGIGKKLRRGKRVDKKSIPRKVNTIKTVASVAAKAGVEAAAVAETVKNLQSMESMKNRLLNLRGPKNPTFLQRRLRMGRMGPM